MFLCRILVRNSVGIKKPRNNNTLYYSLEPSGQLSVTFKTHRAEWLDVINYVCLLKWQI